MIIGKYRISVAKRCVVIFSFPIFSLSVTGPAGLGTLWVSMAAIAGCRVDSAVDRMAGKIVSTVRHPAIIFGLVPDGRFQLDPDSVTIAAKTSPMAQTADGAVLGGHQTMVVRKINRVIKFYKRDYGLFHVMAVCAKAQILAFHIGVPGRRRISALQGRASPQQTEC